MGSSDRGFHFHTTLLTTAQGRLVRDRRQTWRYARTYVAADGEHPLVGATLIRPQ